MPIHVFNELHRESLEFLRTELAKDSVARTIVVSHHVPTLKNYPIQYAGNALNEAFVSEQSALIEESKPAWWIYGHHHSLVPPFRIGKTTLLTNQLGYVQNNEHHFFEPDRTFLVQE